LTNSGILSPSNSRLAFLFRFDCLLEIFFVGIITASNRLNYILNIYKFKKQLKIATTKNKIFFYYFSPVGSYCNLPDPHTDPEDKMSTVLHPEHLLQYTWLGA